MKDQVYDLLADTLGNRGGAFPAIKSTVFRELVEAIFTEDDATLAAVMPLTPVTADEMAAKTGRPLEAVREALDTMARKGILFSTIMGEKRIYHLLPMIPGILENQVMSGVVNDYTRKISKLTEDYLNELLELEKAGDKRLPKIPFARVITVDHEIPGESVVQPYDRLLAYLDKLEDFALTTCHCRQIAELTGHPCSKPKDVCMALGMTAKYLAEYGMAKRISKQEALDVLKRAEDEGLVHMTGNTGDYINFICNCCSCHCDIIKSFKRSPEYRRAAKSSFVAEVQADECVGCGDCLPRCPVEAISMPDDTACVDDNVCIGCGLCVSTCPTGAIALRPSEAAPVPYKDSIKLNQAIVASTQQD